MPVSDHGFSGSYELGDVEFLLRRMEVAPLPTEERERLVGSGERHYSEMMGTEDRPSRERMQVFRECLRLNQGTLATDLVSLAHALNASAEGEELTLVSIARAGTPIGVIVRKLLIERLGWTPGAVRHYSVSVIRDFGLDRAAMHHILARHSAASVRFIDGWTGKGTIATEVARSIRRDSRLYRHVDPGLWVPLDISGVSRWAANSEDYLLPLTVLGGTVSGLVSRSILRAEDRKVARWHGCAELSNLRKYDVSRWFVKHMTELGFDPSIRARVGHSENRVRAAECRSFVEALISEFGLSDTHGVKIGIGEAVRASLRRMPYRIMLRSLDSGDGLLVRRLASLRGIPVEHRPDMPVTAAALIKTSSLK